MVMGIMVKVKQTNNQRDHEKICGIASEKKTTLLEMTKSRYGRESSEGERRACIN